MKKNKQKGTTIIELLIYMGLLIMFLTILLDVFVTTLNFKLQAESTSALNQDTRYIFQKMAYDIYNSDSFSVPNPSELDFVQAGIVNRYTVLDGDLLKNGERLNGLDTKIGSITYTLVGSTVRVAATLNSQIKLPGSTETQSFETTLAGRRQ